MVSFRYVLVFLNFFEFLKFFNFSVNIFFNDEKHTQWNLDTKVKIFHESISCFMKCPWNCFHEMLWKENFSFILPFLTHIKWDVFISLSLRLLLKCEFDTDVKLENYSHHDGEQLLFIKKYISIEGCSCNLYIQKQPPEVFCKKAVVRNFVKFTGKQLCQRLFFHKFCRPRLQLY